MSKNWESEVDKILDGWFGEPLGHSDQEDQLRRYLYDPLRKLTREAFQAGREHKGGHHDSF